MKRKILALILGASMLLALTPAVAETDDTEATVTVSEEVTIPAPTEEEPTQAPTTEAPTAEPTEKPTEAPTEVPTEQPTQAPTEVPTQEPTQAPTEIPTEQPTEVPFAADVEIQLENDGALYFGDLITLRAKVENANAEYAVVWQYCDAERLETDADPWVELCTGEKYEFTADEENTAYIYRIVVNDVVISEEYTLPEVTARPEESEAPEETVEPEEAEETPEPEAETSLADALNPERGIDIYLNWGGGELNFGDEVQLIAVPRGYDNAVYTLQWQTSADGAEWADVPGATEQIYTNVVTQENYQNQWRVVLTVTEAETEPVVEPDPIVKAEPVADAPEA